MSWNKCRLCASHDQNFLVKYGVRHYAHLQCALAKWGVSFFDRLTPWQISRLPWWPLKQAGLLEEARRRMPQERADD